MPDEHGKLHCAQGCSSQSLNAVHASMLLHWCAALVAAEAVLVIMLAW
jgi:hypothetical protein